MWKTVAEGLVAGLWFGILGFCCAHVIVRDAQGEGWEVFPGCAGTAGFVTGFSSWWLILAGPGVHTIARGLSAGAVVGLLSHPFAWYFMIVANYVSGTKPVGDEALDPLTGLGGAVIFSIGSWACVGWLTLPVGAIAGAALTPLLKWSFRSGT